MKAFFQNHARRWSRCTAAALIAGGLLTIPAFAAEITPSVTKITLAQSQKSFTVDVSLQESEQFAGAEFGLKLPDGMTLDQVEFLEVTKITLAQSQKSFTVDVSLQESEQFAGAEFGLKLPDGMTLDQVEFLDQTIQDAAHTPEVTADGLSFFGFYAAENVFSGKMNVARLTFIYDGAADASIVLGRSKVVTVQEDGTTVGDTSSEPFTIEVTRKSADLTAFADVSEISGYAKDALSWANASGLISGRSASVLAPKDTATRAEAASILVRFEQKIS